LEYFPHTPDKALAVRRTQADKQEAVVRCWGELSKVGEVQILCDQESLVLLGGADGVWYL
jgi:hypothetical protein